MVKITVLMAMFAGVCGVAALPSAVLAAPAASPAPAARGGASAPPGGAPVTSGTGHVEEGGAEANKEVMVPDDPSAAHNAARTRMHECGHQWSSLKKNGAAAGLTWKEFSQECLARR